MARLSQMIRRSIIDSGSFPFKYTKDYDKYKFLGDLFLVADDENVVDISGNYEINSTCSFLEINDYSKGSIGFDGSDSNIVIDLKLDIEDFTIDWWEYPKNNNYNLPNVQYLYYKEFSIIIKNDGNSKLVSLSSDGINWDIANSKYMGEVVKDIWTHWALVKCNDNFYTFINGEIRNIWKSDKVVNFFKGPLVLGGGLEGTNFLGRLKNVRVTNKQALWTERFDIEEDLFY